MAKSLFINRVRLPEFSLLEPRPNDQLRLTQNTFSAPIIQYCRETSLGLRSVSVLEAHIAFGRPSTPASNQAGCVQVAA